MRGTRRRHLCSRLRLYLETKELLMNRFQFPVAVAVTSVALVLIVVGAAGLVVANASANAPFMSVAAAAGAPWSGRWNGHGDWQLPPQLAGLADIPAGQRFSHFRGVDVQLIDKDDKPVDLNVVPGVATAVTQSSLTINANDGSTRTFVLDAGTTIHGPGHSRNAPADPRSVAQNDQVAVLTLNNSPTATAVIVVGR
jgi:hypothetical protein